jgi:cobalt-zinc-cadmium efflux system outer membrane protein
VAVVVAEQRERAARLELASNWSGAAAEITAVSGRLDVVALPPLADLEAALESSPVIRRSAAEQQRQTRARDLASALGTPDLDVEVGFRRLYDLPAGAWVVGATMTLPLFDRQRDRVTAAANRAEAALRSGEAARIDALTALRVAYSGAETSLATIAAIDREVLPPQERAYAAVVEGYAAGRFSLLQVLDARTGLTDSRRARLGALTDLHEALVSLHTLLGSTPNLFAPQASGVSR